MKTLNVRYLVLILASLLIIAGCKKKEGEDISLFIGNYVISDASLVTALTVPTNELGNVPIPVGTDITEALQMALLNSLDCESPADSYVEIRADKSLYLSCMLEDPVNAGTWEELSATSMKLNLNATAIPPSGFSLTITDIVVNANGISGKTNIPLQSPVISALIEPLTLTEEALDDIFIINTSIEFEKQD
jgi:hypothetical protein